MVAETGVWTVNHTRADKPEAEALAQRLIAVGLVEPRNRGIAEAYRLAVRLVAELPDEDILTLAGRVGLRGAEAS